MLFMSYMPHAIFVQTYQNHHREAVIDLVVNIQQNEFQVPVTLADQPDLTDIPSFCQVKNGNFWVALYQNEVVGTIALLDSGNGVGTLRKMFVKANFRGKEWGIAQKLLDELWTWAASHGYAGVYLGTIERLQAARRFYEKNGFELIQKNNLPAQFPMMAVDTHFYAKQVVLA